MPGLSEEELEIQFKQEDFIAMQQGALEKAVKDGFAQGIKQGLQQRREQGVELSKIEIARNMLRDQMPVERICKYIGLEREVVEQLQQDDQE